MQFLSQYSNFPQLKYLSLQLAFFLVKFLSLDIIIKSPVTPIARLLMNLASAEAKICCILLIVLSSRFNILAIVVSKLSYRKSSVMTIAILSYMSRFGIIAARSCFIRNCTSAKILMISFLKSFDLLICG